MNDNSNKIPVYLFKGKPLQNKFNNDYNRAEKIEIILQLQNDFDNGILSPHTLLSIIYNKLYGSFVAVRLLNEMQQKNIIKKNPFTNDNKPILPKKTVFDW
jgi:hypothetical protein